MDESLYTEKLEKLFVRFPSVQNVGFNDAYKPGLANMENFCELLGNPEDKYRTIHVAGTNGKGSVSNMLASALAAKGMKVGIYTSPHILDFRERMRVIDGSKGRDASAEMISKEDVWDFITDWEEDFDTLKLSFFEITTGMAFWWFKKCKVDVAVMETGLGGRLDSTNVITPELSIITSIGLDHCALLGDIRAKIAAEKAGIFKPGVPALVSCRDEETAPVFEKIAAEKGASLNFADAEDPRGWERSDVLLGAMDLQGGYQSLNLRTTLSALSILGIAFDETIADALCRTAERMDFHGRWEMISRDPDTICDIGHNPPALEKNFAQLVQYLEEGRYSQLIMVYGVMADKDLSGILPLMPADAQYILVAPDTARAMPSSVLYERCLEYWQEQGRPESGLIDAGSVEDGVELARNLAEGHPGTLIYIGGSTFVVSEAV